MAKNFEEKFTKFLFRLFRLDDQNNSYTPSKPLILYTANCYRIKFRFSDEVRERVIALCKERSLVFLDIADSLINHPTADLLTQEPWLWELMPDKPEHSSKLFNGPDPLTNRRAAISYAESFLLTAEEMGGYYNVLPLQEFFELHGTEAALRSFGNEVGLYTISVSYDYSGIPCVIRTMFSHDIITLERLEDECSAYRFNGFDMGSSEPHRAYIPALDRVIELLPDEAPFVPGYSRL